MKKENWKNLVDKNKESLMGIFEHPLVSNEIEEVLERKVVGIGNGAHINIPLKHINKEARILIKRKKEEESQS